MGGIFSRLCTIQSENVVIKSEHAQTMNQLTAQNEALRNSFRDQVRHLQEEHRKTVETLQQQLSKIETQLFQLKSEPSTKSKLVIHYSLGGGEFKQGYLIHHTHVPKFKLRLFSW